MADGEEPASEFAGGASEPRAEFAAAFPAAEELLILDFEEADLGVGGLTDRRALRPRLLVEVGVDGVPVPDAVGLVLADVEVADAKFLLSPLPSSRAPTPMTPARTRTAAPAIAI